ncbi:hypothetical protein [Streptomyces sp. NPDC059165]
MHGLEVRHGWDWASRTRRSGAAAVRATHDEIRKLVEGPVDEIAPPTSA